MRRPGGPIRPNDQVEQADGEVLAPFLILHEERVIDAMNGLPIRIPGELSKVQLHERELRRVDRIELVEDREDPGLLLGEVLERRHENRDREQRRYGPPPFLGKSLDDAIMSAPWRNRKPRADTPFSPAATAPSGSRRSSDRSTSPRRSATP